LGHYADLPDQLRQHEDSEFTRPNGELLPVQHYQTSGGYLVRRRLSRQALLHVDVDVFRADFAWFLGEKQVLYIATAHVVHLVGVNLRTPAQVMPGYRTATAHTPVLVRCAADCRAGGQSAPSERPRANQSSVDG